jgi:hypothetical protein
MWRRKFHKTEGCVLRCSFCNKPKEDVARLIAGPNVFICEECVEICNDIIADDRRVSKQAGGHTAEREEVKRWPNSIECALCRKAVPVEQSVVINKRGILCSNCVETVRTAHIISN